MFKTILKYIIHLNLIIATSAGLLIAGVSNIFGIDNYLYYGLFGFFSTFCVYNSQRLFKANSEAKTPWLKWVLKHRKLILILGISSGLLAGYFFFKLLNNVTLPTIMLVSLSILISLFYVVRICEKNIRELAYLKIHSIALTWTLVIVSFPIINESIYNWELLIFFIPAHYLYFVAVAIPFDIRDLNHDLPTQKTIPQVVGLKKAKIISILLLTLTAIGTGLAFPFLLMSSLYIVAILMQILLAAFAAEKHNEIYYSVLLDGSIALLGLSYLVLDKTT